MSPVPVAETEISVDQTGPALIWTLRNFYKGDSGRVRSRLTGLIWTGFKKISREYSCEHHQGNQLGAKPYRRAQSSSLAANVITIIAIIIRHCITPPRPPPPPKKKKEKEKRGWGCHIEEIAERGRWRETSPGAGKQQTSRSSYWSERTAWQYIDGSTITKTNSAFVESPWISFASITPLSEIRTTTHWDYHSIR